MGLSIVSVNRHKSYPLAVEQIVKEPRPEKTNNQIDKNQTTLPTQKSKTKQAKAKTGASKAQNAKSDTEQAQEKKEQPRPKGRPKGSKNKPKEKASKDIQYFGKLSNHIRFLTYC